MTRPLLPVAFAALCFVLSAPLSSPVRAQTDAVQRARVIVKFKSDAAAMRKQMLSVSETHAERARALGARVGVALGAGQGVGSGSQVVTARGMSSQALAARLSQDAEVEYAVVDGRKHIVAAPNDPLYPASASNSPTAGQWYLRAPDSAVASSSNSIVSSINAEPAWAVTKGSNTVVVAVLDTGVRFNHPDLQKVADGGNYLDGYDFVSDAAMANDGDGRDADPSDPGDWLTQADLDTGKFPDCTSADITDSSWHGTQTSALIGAMTNNGLGMASVGRNVRILPVRVLGKCGGSDSDILVGMRWAAGIHVDGVPDNPNPAKVLNMSLGGGAACSAAYAQTVSEINARGAIVVASAGNGSADGGHAVVEPANCAGVIAVAAVRNIGTKVGFSDLGPEVAISAPGGNCVNDVSTSPNLPCLYPIPTATNAGRQGPGAAAYTGSNAATASLGTSFSAPLVSGAAALVLSADASLTPTQVRNVLSTTAREFPTSGPSGTNTPVCRAPSSVGQSECYCTKSTCGAGMLDVGAAVRAAAVLQPNINVMPSAPVATSAVSLDSGQSNAAADRQIVGRAWSVVDSGGIVGVPDVSADAVMASFTPSAAGSFTVALTLTDDLGTTATSTRTVTVAAAPGTPSSVTPPPPSGGGGGGALSTAWLLALLAAIALLGMADRRRT